jgi:N-acylneuraminate cytidylyltransferase
LIRTQELPPLLEENSCIYIFSREVFTKRKNRIGYNPLLYPVNPYEAVDIDEMIDFDIAEYLMKKRLEDREN